MDLKEVLKEPCSHDPIGEEKELRKNAAQLEFKRKYPSRPHGRRLSWLASIFGDLCSTLEPVASAFINVWQITIVPSVVISLLLGIGGLK